MAWMGVFYYVENIRARESRHHGDVPRNKYKLVKSYLLTIGKGKPPVLPATVARRGLFGRQFWSLIRACDVAQTDRHTHTHARLHTTRQIQPPSFSPRDAV